MVEFGGKTYTFPPFVNEKEIFAEWRTFKRASAKEKKTMKEKKKATLSTRCENRDGAFRSTHEGFFKRY